MNIMNIMTESLSQPRSQPSRKSKRSWRKNINLIEVEEGLKAARAESLHTGVSNLAEIPSEALFRTDTSGAASLAAQYRRSRSKVKADEILAQRSATPAIHTKRRSPEHGMTTNGIIGPRSKRGHGIGQAEKERLQSVAFHGERDWQENSCKEEDTAHDIWAPSDSVIRSDTTSVRIVPQTMKEGPSVLTVNGTQIPSVRTPTGGRSYNPSFEEWSQLLEIEGAKAVENETLRIRRMKDLEQFSRLNRGTTVVDEIGASHTDNESEYESEWEGIQSDFEGTEHKSNPPARKTPSQRNKSNRRKAAESHRRHHERMRERTSRYHATNTNTELDTNTTNNLADSEEQNEEPRIKRRKFVKHSVPAAPLELVLPEELKESLRLLKPEGNLLEDRFRSVVLQGKLEPRKPVGQTKKPRRKYTEKWSYKDWAGLANFQSLS